jgi:mannose-1-phosphate guanylyltransferase
MAKEQGFYKDAGLDGYIVAENDNSLLVCKLSEEQRIRQFAEE